MADDETLEVLELFRTLPGGKVSIDAADVAAALDCDETTAQSRLDKAKSGGYVLGQMFVRIVGDEWGEGGYVLSGRGRDALIA